MGLFGLSEEEEKNTIMSRIFVSLNILVSNDPLGALLRNFHPILKIKFSLLQLSLK